MCTQQTAVKHCHLCRSLVAGLQILQAVHFALLDSNKLQLPDLHAFITCSDNGVVEVGVEQEQLLAKDLPACNA